MYPPRTQFPDKDRSLPPSGEPSGPNGRVPKIALPTGAKHRPQTVPAPIPEGSRCRQQRDHAVRVNAAPWPPKTGPSVVAPTSNSARVVPSLKRPLTRGNDILSHRRGHPNPSRSIRSQHGLNTVSTRSQHGLNTVSTRSQQGLNKASTPSQPGPITAPPPSKPCPQKTAPDPTAPTPMPRRDSTRRQHADSKKNEIKTASQQTAPAQQTPPCPPPAPRAHSKAAPQAPHPGPPRQTSGPTPRTD